jgi:hypothetical protein
VGSNPTPPKLYNLKVGYQKDNRLFLYWHEENCGVVPLNDKKGHHDTQLKRKGLISCVVMGKSDVAQSNTLN